MSVSDLSAHDPIPPKGTARITAPPRNPLLLPLIFLLTSLISCQRIAPQPQPGRLQVVSTVSTASPITNIVCNVSGDLVDLTGLVPAGTDSHTFQLAPSDAVLDTGLAAGASNIYSVDFTLPDPAAVESDTHARASPRPRQN